MVADAQLPGPGTTSVGGVEIPAGTIVEGRYWISNQPVEVADALWESLASQYDQTGLWPLLVRNFVGSETRPWFDASYYTPAPDTEVAALEPLEIVDRLWSDAEIDGALRTPIGDRIEQLVAPAAVTPPDLELAAHREYRLLLVPAARPADAVAAVGWSPASLEPAEVAAVLRSWEDRFGWYVYLLTPEMMETRVGEVSFDTEDDLFSLGAEVYGLAPGTLAGGDISLEDFSTSLTDPGFLVFWWD